MTAALSIIGLALTAFGAWRASKSVMVSLERAAELAETHWDGNERLRESIIEQPRATRDGLLMIVAGTVLQIFSAVLSAT